MIMHCNRAQCGTIYQTCTRSTACASGVSVASLPACAAACVRRQESHWLFCRAHLAHARRTAAELVNLGHTSTPELACDAGTSSTLSAGVLGRCGALAHLPCSGSSAESQREQRESTLESLSCSATIEFSSPFSEVDGSMTLRERHRTMYLRHAVDGRPRRERDCSMGLRLIVWNSQILLS